MFFRGIDAKIRVTIPALFNRWVAIPAGLIGIVVSSMFFFMANIQGVVEMFAISMPVQSRTNYLECVTGVNIDNGLYVKGFEFEVPGQATVSFVRERYGGSDQQRIDIKYRKGCPK